MTLAVVLLGVAAVVATAWAVAVTLRLRRSEATPAVVPEPAGESQEDASLARLVAALDALDLGVVVADADGSVAFRNRAADAVLTSRDSRQIVNGAVGELLADAGQGRPGEREIDLFGPPKSTYLIRAVALEGAPGGDAAGGSVAVIDDITERRRTDQVRRDFVSNISHELKTPVGAVGLLAETLRDEDDPATIGRFTERISLEVARLGRTIDDLLELSRIEFADDLLIEECAVAAIVDEAIGRFRSAAEARGIVITAEGADDVVVHGDRRQITSALSNLLDNAVKYSPDGSAISVTTRSDDDVVHLVVTDAGDGIPSRDLDRVFERFYRVDRARSRETGGTGLGLAIVRHVARNHGGEVSVSSREGQGSQFTLSLPLTGPHRSVRAASPQPSPAPGVTA